MLYCDYCRTIACGVCCVAGGYVVCVCVADDVDVCDIDDAVYGVGSVVALRALFTLLIVVVV